MSAVEKGQLKIQMDHHMSLNVTVTIQLYTSREYTGQQRQRGRETNKEHFVSVYWDT